MSNFRKNFEIFILFSRYSLKTILQARLGIVLFTLGKIIRFLFLLGLIVLIFGKLKVVKGYTLEQAILFYLTYNLIDTGTQVLFREVYRFRSMVLFGGLDHVLLKPYHPFVRILLGGVDFMDLILFIPYILITLYVASISFDISVINVLLYLILFINGLVIAAAFHIFALSLGILTTEIDHTMMIYRDLTSIGRFPLNIYKEPVRTLFTFLIPVGVMMAFPVYAFLNQLSLILTILAFLISFILLTGSVSLWNHALKKYQSYGG